jgi:hypothetical protein
MELRDGGALVPAGRLTVEISSGGPALTPRRRLLHPTHCLHRMGAGWFVRSSRGSVQGRWPRAGRNLEADQAPERESYS